MLWKKGEGFSLRHLKQLILHDNSQQNLVTSCSLTAPIGMKCDKKEKMRAKQGDETNLKK